MGRYKNIYYFHEYGILHTEMNCAGKKMKGKVDWHFLLYKNIIELFFKALTP